VQLVTSTNIKYKSLHIFSYLTELAGFDACNAHKSKRRIVGFDAAVWKVFCPKRNEAEKEGNFEAHICDEYHRVAMD
jgi:hypothetical protein